MNTMHLAGCVILDNQGRILLLHRNKDGLQQWELPGGKVDSGEDGLTTAKREIKEELYVAVEIIQELGGADFVFEETICTYQWFLAKIRKGEPRIGEPQTFDDMRYIPLEEMESLTLSANMKNLYEKLRSGSVEL